jgi:hypothetical protein
VYVCTYVCVRERECVSYSRPNSVLTSNRKGGALTRPTQASAKEAGGNQKPCVVVSLVTPHNLRNTPTWRGHAQRDNTGRERGTRRATGTQRSHSEGTQHSNTERRTQESENRHARERDKVERGTHRETRHSHPPHTQSGEREQAPLSLSLTHTLSLSHTHTHARTHTNIISLSLGLSQKCPPFLSLSLSSSSSSSSLSLSPSSP